MGKHLLLGQSGHLLQPDHGMVSLSVFRVHGRIPPRLEGLHKAHLQGGRLHYPLRRPGGRQAQFHGGAGRPFRYLLHPASVREQAEHHAPGHSGRRRNDRRPRMAIPIRLQGALEQQPRAANPHSPAISLVGLVLRHGGGMAGDQQHAEPFGGGLLLQLGRGPAFHDSPLTRSPAHPPPSSSTASPALARRKSTCAPWPLPWHRAGAPSCWCPKSP